MSYSKYTHETEERFTLGENKLYDRFQAEFDYNGATDSDGDSADYYRPSYAIARAVRVG